MKMLFYFFITSFLFCSFAFVFFFKQTGYPTEAIQIAGHYLFGNGEDLYLKSNYLPESPVIKKHLKSMKIGETKRISFIQKEDWRLSYALNPFHLKKNKNGFELYQYISFDHTGTVFTYIKTPFGNIKIKDNIVHVKKCFPFMVRYTYSKSS
jgi:hypothetical protein